MTAPRTEKSSIDTSKPEDSTAAVSHLRTREWGGVAAGGGGIGGVAKVIRPPSFRRSGQFPKCCTQ